jgi:hypothetical protein
MAPLPSRPHAAAARAHTPARVPWIAAALPTAALAALAVLVLLRHAPPPIATTPAAQPPARGAAPSPTVEVVLDSMPQGAAVTADATGPGAVARPLGETPLVLRLPRGDAPVALTLAKEGFAPLPFKVAPNRDKDVVAPLERSPAAAVAAADPRPRRHAGSAVARRSSPVAPQDPPPTPQPAPPARAAAPAAAPATMATVHFRNDAGDGFELVEARFVIDDHPLPVMTSAPRTADTVIYAGPVRPGRHVVSARLVYQGRNRGPFTYLSGYKLNVESREVIEVPADRAATFTIATEKKKGVNVPLDKQLAITVRDDSRRALR